MTVLRLSVYFKLYTAVAVLRTAGRVSTGHAPAPPYLTRVGGRNRPSGSAGLSHFANQRGFWAKPTKTKTPAWMSSLPITPLHRRSPRVSELLLQPKNLMVAPQRTSASTLPPPAEESALQESQKTVAATETSPTGARAAARTRRRNPGPTTHASEPHHHIPTASTHRHMILGFVLPARILCRIMWPPLRCTVCEQ